MFNHATHRLQREFPQAVMTLNGVPRFQKFLPSIRDQAPATDFKDLGIFEIRNRYVTTCSWFDLPLRQLDEEVANMGLVSLLEALTIKISGVSSRCFLLFLPHSGMINMWQNRWWNTGFKLSWK